MRKSVDVKTLIGTAVVGGITYYFGRKHGYNEHVNKLKTIMAEEYIDSRKEDKKEEETE